MTRNLSDNELYALLEGNLTAHIGFFDGLLPHVMPAGYLFRDNRLWVVPQTAQGIPVPRLEQYGEVCIAIDGQTEENTRHTVSVWGSCHKAAKGIPAEPLLKALRKKYQEKDTDKPAPAGFSPEGLFRMDIKYKKGFSEIKAAPAIRQMDLTGRELLPLRVGA